MTTEPPPSMRVTNIALDFNELPREITVIASEVVAERINEQYDDGHGARFVAQEPVTLPIATAAEIAQHFGRIPSPDDTVREIWSCLTGSVFNRFWDGGLFDYEASR